MPIRKVGSDTPSSDSRHHQLRAEAAAPQRRVHAQRDADQQRDHRGGERQLQRRREALDDQRRHLAALAQAEAELALHRIADEARELHREGLVQAEVARAAARAARAWRPGPSMLLTGSPTYWNSMKAMKATVSITITACSRRRRMKASIGRSGAGAASPPLGAAIAARRHGRPCRTRDDAQFDAAATGDYARVASRSMAVRAEARIGPYQAAHAAACCRCRSSPPPTAAPRGFAEGAPVVGARSRRCSRQRPACCRPGVDDDLAHAVGARVHQGAAQWSGWLPKTYIRVA